MAINYGRRGKQESPDDFMSPCSSGGETTSSLLHDFVAGQEKLKNVRSRTNVRITERSWREEEAAHRQMDSMRKHFREGGMTFTPDGPESDPDVW